MRHHRRRLPGIAFLLAALAGPLAAQADASRSGDTTSVRIDLPLIRRADAARTLGAGPGGAVDTLRPTLHEFVDFACPDCRRFSSERGDSLRTLVTTSRANLVFRVAPIPRLLRGARAAEAAFCAGGLGGAPAFHAMERAIFAGQDTWRQRADGTDLFVGYALTAGVDTAAFHRCLRVGATMPLVLADLRLAGLFAIDGTPTLVATRPEALAVAARVVGEPAIARIMAALQQADSADLPAPDAGALLGTWRVDSIAVFAWHPTLSTAGRAALARSQRAIASTLRDIRAQRLRIETTFSSQLTYSHQLQRGSAVVYRESGHWTVPGGSAVLAMMTDAGTPGTNDRARLVGRVGDHLILERHFTSGAAAGVGERIFLRR